MAQNYDLTQTGPELQARVDQVFPNRDAIEQETVTREAQDESLETSLKAYTDTEQTRAEAAEGALDTRVSANEVDIDLLKSQYEALTQSDIIVGPLPSTGQPNKIYRVPGSTYYTDYMWANGGWVKLAEYSTLDGYVYKGIATPSGTPVQSAEAVFYFAVQPGTYTNYGGLVVTDTIAILKYNGTDWTKDDLITIDDEPTAGSDNLVTSGAVAASVVYDISAANAVGGQLATYADLAAALNGGSNVPVELRKGGMEIKFVQTSDNKYVQYFLNKDEFTTIVDYWEKMNLEKEVDSLLNKISPTNPVETEESSIVVKNSLNRTILEISEDGTTNAETLKENGIRVATQNDIQAIGNKINIDTTTESEEKKLSIYDDNYQEVAKIQQDGTVFAKDFKKNDGSLLYNPLASYSNINFGAFGDSITAGNQWSYLVSQYLDFNSHSNEAVGSSRWACRKTTVDGVTYETQEYDDPNFAGISGGWEPTSDPVEIQKRMNNCAKVHVQKYISEVTNQTYPIPDLVCLAYGTNDNKDPDGTDDAIATKTSYPTGDNLFTLAGGMKWCLQKIRETWPNCVVIVLLPIQRYDSWSNSQNKIKIEQIIKICNAMSIPYIDMFNKCGIASILENGEPNYGPYLADGLHPNAAGRILMAKYAAAQIQSLFINIKNI